jgi:hypothetical protein
MGREHACLVGWMGYGCQVPKPDVCLASCFEKDTQFLQDGKLAKGRHICYNTRRCLMKNWKIVTLVYREIRAIARLSPWGVAALLVAIVLRQADLNANSGLFQSPPKATATAVPTTPVPTDTPLPEPTATLTEAPTVTLVPSDTPEPTASPTEVSATATMTPTEVSPTVTPIPSPDSVESAAETEGDQRYSNDDSDLKFEWSMLFDSVALGISYLWLCCGVLVLMGIPVFFVILWVVSKRRQQFEE